MSSKRRAGHAKHAADSDSSLEDEDDDDDDLFDRLKDDFDRLKQENLPPPPKSVKLQVFVVVGQAYHRKMVKLRCDLAQLSDLHAEIDAIFVPELSPSGQRVADLEMQYLDSVTGQPVLFQSAATADAAAEQIAAVLRSSAILLSDRPIAELVARARDAPAGASQAGEAAGGIRLAAMASRPKSKKQLSGGRGRKLLVDGSSSCSHKPTWGARGKKLLTLGSASMSASLGMRNADDLAGDLGDLADDLAGDLVEASEDREPALGEASTSAGGRT